MKGTKMTKISVRSFLMAQKNVSGFRFFEQTIKERS